MDVFFADDARLPQPVRELRQRCERHSTDLKLLRELGQLCRAHQLNSEAVSVYQALAGAYAAQGLVFRAVAVCKEILAIDQTHEQTHTVLAALYAKAGERTELPMAMATSLTPRSAADAATQPAVRATPPRPTPHTDAPGSATRSGSMPPIPLDDDEDVIDVTGLGAAMTILPEGSVALAAPHDVPLFSGLSRAAFVALVKSLRAFSAEPGTPILLEGENSDSIYVIARGKVRIEKASSNGSAPVQLGELGVGAFFGEVAWLSKSPRGASVFAVEHTELLELTASGLADLHGSDDGVREMLEDFCEERVLHAALSTSPVFAGLPLHTLSAALRGFTQQNLERGTIVIVQGDDSPGLCIALVGSFDVVASTEIGSVRLKRLVPGDVFGEMSLLSKGATANATVSVSDNEDARMLTLSKESFHALCAAHPALLHRVEALSEQRHAFNAMFVPNDDPASGSGARSGAV